MIKYIARQIVMFMKKHDLNIHDLSQNGRDDWMWFYNLYYTEYKDRKMKDLEVSCKENIFQNSFKIDFSFKGIELHINDLPWFLMRNRYLINNIVEKNWYYNNFEYFFESEKDMNLVIKKFKKHYNVFCEEI